MEWGSSKNAGRNESSRGGDIFRMKEHCGNCKYYKEYLDRSNGSIVRHGCLRRSPVVAMQRDVEHNILEPYPWFPRMPSDGWCGEWEKIEKNEMRYCFICAKLHKLPPKIEERLTGYCDICGRECEYVGEILNEEKCKFSLFQ